MLPGPSIAEEKSAALDEEENQATVVVQNCGQVGLQVCKLLAAQGHSVRVAGRNPDKIRSDKIAGTANIEAYASGDLSIFAGANFFVCLPPATQVKADRVRLAKEFLSQAKAANVTSGSILSLITASQWTDTGYPSGEEKQTGQGVYGPQFAEVEAAAAELGLQATSSGLRSSSRTTLATWQRSRRAARCMLPSMVTCASL